MLTHPDHFSQQAAAYRRFRPTYPDELFAYLAGVVPWHTCAWDCATGNGQAAVRLAEHFDRVVATDASAAQLAEAASHPCVQYMVAPAEQVPMAADSVDLITVAQALHWLDRPAFYAEARRVLQPGGVLAAWTYGLAEVSPAVDAVVHRFYEHLVGPYWPPERVHVERGYDDLELPFERLAAPPFTMEHAWTAEQLKGYLGTWSAAQRYREANGVDPVSLIEAELAEAWGDVDARCVVRWPLTLLLGRLAA